jgi:hypothetical protein
MDVNILGSTAHVLRFEAFHGVRNGAFDFAQGFHRILEDSGLRGMNPIG